MRRVARICAELRRLHSEHVGRAAFAYPTVGIPCGTLRTADTHVDFASRGLARTHKLVTAKESVSGARVAYDNGSDVWHFDGDAVTVWRLSAAAAPAAFE